MTYSLKSFVFAIIALVGAFLVTFVIPDFDYAGVITIIASVAGFFGVADFREQFEKSVTFFKTKTMVGALLIAVPMVALAVIGFFGLNLPPALLEALKYLVQLGGGWLILGASNALTKKTV